MTPPGRSLLLGAAACILACLAAGDALAEMRDVNRFVGPKAACAPPAPGRIRTSVGRLPVVWASKAYEVVADTRLERTADDVPYGDPSITVFDENCEPVWRQSFPRFGEIGFDILEVPGGPLLHVVGRSVFEPVDDEYLIDEILYPLFGSVLALAPVALLQPGDATYVGRIGTGNTFGVVVVTNDEGWRRSPARRTVERALVYRWRAFERADGRTMHAFAGPRILDRSGLAALHLPEPTLPPFPLHHFVFGD